MNYETFKEFILEYLSDQIGSEYTITVKPVIKNNHTQKEGIYIRKEHQASSPIIHLDTYFDRYLDGESLAILVEEMTNIWAQNVRPFTSFQQSLYDFEYVSEKIIFRLINYKENESLLQSIPHRQFLDLAVIYCVLADCSEDGLATAIVYNRHLSIWEKTEEDLYRAALRNTPKLLPYRFRPLEDLIFELYQEADEDLLDFLPCFNQVLDSPYIPMYVLTNTFGLHGAGCLLYPQLLEQIACKLQSDYFVLPSSIHELIFVPSTPALTAVSLQEMVFSVNRNNLPPADVLSDSVYLYQAKHHRLDII